MSNFSMITNMLLALAAAGIPIHFFAYVLIGRRAAVLRSERGIFFYHLVSACMLSSLACISMIVAPSPETAALAATIVASHGIYSLTFLEFWTLSQISYSREILLRIKADMLDDANTVLQELVDIGEQKRAGRLEALSAMRLIEERENEWRLTTKGRAVSVALRLLQWLPNMKEAG